MLTAEVAPRTRCLLHLNLGLTYQFLGRYHDSDIRLRRAHQDAVAHGFPDLAAAAVHNRGRLQMLLGNLPRSLSLMEQAREMGGELLPPRRGRSTGHASSPRPASSTRHWRRSKRVSRRRGPAASLTTSPRPTSSGRGWPCCGSEHADARRYAARAERRFARGVGGRHGRSVRP